MCLDKWLYVDSVCKAKSKSSLNLSAAFGLILSCRPLSAQINDHRLELSVLNRIVSDLYQCTWTNYSFVYWDVEMRNVFDRSDPEVTGAVSPAATHG